MEIKAIPVYFFKTDTSGEKPYEEFYTEHDKIDSNSFNSLGIIKNKDIPSLYSIDVLLNEFNIMFENNAVDKAAIVSLIGKHLTDFQHIETGKTLDQRM